jgi:tetratricopeptide (TPR) repeat protein
MTASVGKPFPNRWLTGLRQDPESALNDLLSGLARIPPFERATPSETLKRLFGGLRTDDPDVQLLDEALCMWLVRRWRNETATSREAYGVPRFVTEYMDALSVVWLLRLPKCGAWLQDNYLALALWAAPLRLSRVWDLPLALATAAALTQSDSRLRFCWYRLCSDAARPSRRSLIDPALIGLSNLPDTAGQGASKELIGGLARFGAGLEATPKDQLDFIRSWRTIKVRFPRVSKTWNSLWHNALFDPRYDESPFRDWLLSSDPGLFRAPVHRGASPLPSRQQLLAVLDRIRAGDRDAVLRDAQALLTGYEQYAESTGDADYFVRSAGNLAGEVVLWAPGHALAWARDALRWFPNHAQSWSIRARALVRMGRRDLAQAVLWEAARRLPGNAFVRTQLALLLEEHGSVDQAEQLLREALVGDPKNPGACVEFARLLGQTGRLDDAEVLLRQSVEDHPENPIILYTLVNVLIARGRLPDALSEAGRYTTRFGENPQAAGLRQLIQKGPTGITQAQRKLAERHVDQGDVAQLADADRPAWERAVVGEQRADQSLRNAARVGRADLLFRLDDGAQAETILQDAVQVDDDYAYARVVWALYDKSKRADLANRYRASFGELAPHLAAADFTTPEAIWSRLRDEFPERLPLIDFTRLMRCGPDELASQRLAQWLEGTPLIDDAHLHARLHALVERDERIDAESDDQRSLLNSALRSEVEVLDPFVQLAA